MSKKRETPQIPFPKGWTKQVRSAVLHVISCGQNTEPSSKSCVRHEIWSIRADWF